jgi:hypothetical protein
VGDEENGRGEGNRGLVYYSEDAASDGDSNGNSVRERGVEQGGGGDGGLGLFLLIVLIFDIHNCHCKNEWGRRGGRRRMWFELSKGHFILGLKY